jgi:peroxiredoxin
LTERNLYNGTLKKIFDGGSVTPKTGDFAPDFELPAVTGTERQKFKLSDWRGKKNVVLAFYALDWSPT